MFATGVAFSWEDITPVSMLALDQFVLWVNAEPPYQTPQQLMEASRSRPLGGLTLGGAEQRNVCVRLFETLRGLPEWQAFMAQGAFNPTSMSGDPFVKGLRQTAHFPLLLMREAKSRRAEP